MKTRPRAGYFTFLIYDPFEWMNFHINIAFNRDPKNIRTTYCRLFNISGYTPETSLSPFSPRDSLDSPQLSQKLSSVDFSMASKSSEQLPSDSDSFRPLLKDWERLEILVSAVNPVNS